MWHYGDLQHFRQPPRPAGSTYDILLGMRGVGVTLLFLDLSDPERPVTQVVGLLADVRPSSLTIDLAAPLPTLEPRARFGVEVMAGPGMLRFQTTAARPVNDGDTKADLHLPRQVESIQRRQFTRVPLSTPIAFAPASEATTPLSAAGGVGQTLDLSAGGLRLVTPAPLRFGDQLFVSFDTPDGRSYRGLRAKVVRTQTDGDRSTVALRFTSLDPETEDSLVRTIFRLQLRGLAKR